MLEVMKKDNDDVCGGLTGIYFKNMIRRSTFHIIAYKYSFPVINIFFKTW